MHSQVCYFHVMYAAFLLMYVFFPSHVCNIYDYFFTLTWCMATKTFRIEWIFLLYIVYINTLHVVIVIFKKNIVPKRQGESLFDFYFFYLMYAPTWVYFPHTRQTEVMYAAWKSCMYHVCDILVMYAKKPSHTWPFCITDVCYSYSFMFKCLSHCLIFGTYWFQMLYAFSCVFHIYVTRPSVWYILHIRIFALAFIYLLIHDSGLLM